MNLIALETSSHHLSVALWQNGNVLNRQQERANGGSDLILPWVNQLLAEAGLTLKQLDGIAFGAGPGGFTGLRLACGVAQGLAYGADLPVLPVSCLQAVALLAADAGANDVYVCLDARMNEVYTAAYHLVEGVPQELQTPAVNPPAMAPLLPEGQGWVGAGDGFTTYAEALTQRLGAQLASVLSTLVPTATAVARLAAPRLAQGEGRPAIEAQPLYVRDKVAFTTAERLARGGVR